MRLDEETREWQRGLSGDHRAAVVRWQGIDRFYERVQAALLLVRPGMMQRIVSVDRSGLVPVVRVEVTPG